MDIITYSSSVIDLMSDSNGKLDASSSDASAADITLELPPSPVLSRPKSYLEKETSSQTSYATPYKPLHPLRNRSATVGVSSLNVAPIEEASSFENLSLIKTDSPLVVERRTSPRSILRSKLSGGFIFSQQVTNNLKILLESFVQEVGLQESRYSLELIIYIFRNCQSHSVDEKYYRIPLVSQAFYNRVWQFNTGRLFMMQCQWTIMDDLLVLSLGFDLSKPFQFLERKLDTVCHKIASLAMAVDGRKSKKYNPKEIRFFDKEIYDAIPSLKQIPEDLNASFTESNSDVASLNPCAQIWTQSPPSLRPRTLTPPQLPPYKPETPQTQKNLMFKPLCLQIRPSPLQIGGYGVSSPLEKATTPLSKSPPSPPRPSKNSSSPARSQGSNHEASFLSFESSGVKNEVFVTPETSFTQSLLRTLPETITVTTTTLYNIPAPSNNNITTSTPLVPKSISHRQTPIMSTSISENSLFIPDNSNSLYKLTADKIGHILPPDSFMDVSLPDNSKPIQDIRGNREAEQQLIQQVTANRQIWKTAEQEKLRQMQAERAPAKRKERTSISSPAGQVVAVMPAHFEFPKLKQCSTSGSESPSPRVSPNSSPPPWASEIKLRSRGNTPAGSPVTSPKYRQKYEEPIFDLKDREVEKSMSKKTANTRQIWLQNEAVATGKSIRPGSAVSCEDLLNKPTSPTERPSSAVSTRTKWSLRELSPSQDVVKGSDPLDKHGLHMDEKMLLEMTKTKKIVLQI